MASFLQFGGGLTFGDNERWFKEAYGLGSMCVGVRHSMNLDADFSSAEYTILS